jgi:protein TonB
VALLETKPQPRPSVVTQPESQTAQAAQALAIGSPSKTKQQPESAPPPARAATETAALPATTQSSSTSKPPAVTKTLRDSGHGTAVERFAGEVQRVASQVLDQRDYPKDARGKDWQGTTQIEVRYAAAGYIQSIVVGESSGYPPLDDTALQIARNMRLPSAPEELRSREFAVRFPIVFRLHHP